MKRTRNPEETRKKILEATHQILREGGYFTTFSLDTVAKTAEISKGGLIHHFPSKVELMQAAAQEAIQRFEERFASNLEQDEGGENGRYTRTYLRTGTEPAISREEVSPLLLAYLRDDTDQQNRFEAWQEYIAQDGIDVVTATIVRLAVDGLIYTELIDNAAIDANLREKIVARLLAMIDSAAGKNE